MGCGHTQCSFSSNASTQTPFLRRVITGRKRYGGDLENLVTYLKRTFKLVFTSASPKGEALNLLRNIASFLDLKDIQKTLKTISWNGATQKFSANGSAAFNSDGIVYENVLSAAVNGITLTHLDAFDELTLMCDLRFITDLTNGYVQFEYIQPLIKRIEVSISALRKVLRVEPSEDNLRPLTIISFRKCNQDIKGVLPLLIAKHFYYQHKIRVGTPPNKTIHLIIDEAHNILSLDPTREEEAGKTIGLSFSKKLLKREESSVCM